MPTLAPRPVHLNETEQKELKQLANRPTTPQQIALRAQIILLASEGKNHRKIARELNISRDMTRLLAFIDYFNPTMAKPFKWTYKGKVLTV